MSPEQFLIEKTKSTTELLLKQKEFCDKYPNEYNIGVYNGLAIGLSVLTGEDPVFYALAIKQEGEEENGES